MTNRELVQRLLAIRTPSVEFALGEEQKLTEELGSRGLGSDLAEIIYEATNETTEPWRVGSLFDHLIWATPDNGRALCESIQGWLMGDDPRKILYRIAMLYILGPGPVEIEAYKRRWPEWAVRFDEMMLERKRQQDWLHNRGPGPIPGLDHRFEH
jgi:hypothetical protein